MHEHVNLVRTCENLIELNMIDQVGILIGKKSTLEKDERVTH